MKKMMELPIRTRVLSCLLLAQYIVVVYIQHKCYMTVMNGDLAAHLILAKEMADADEFLLCRNYFYMTEPYVLHTQILQAVLFRVFTSFKTVFVISFAIHTFLFLAAVVCLVYILTKKIDAGLLSALLVSVPAGEFYIWVFRQQDCLCYALFSVLFFALFFYLEEKIPDAGRLRGHGGIVFFFICFMLLSFMMGMSGTRYLPVTVIPLLAYAFADFMAANNHEGRIILKTRHIASVCSAVSAGAGYLFFRFYLMEKYGPFATTDATFVGDSVIEENIVAAPVVFYDILGGGLSRFLGKSVLSASGIVAFLGIGVITLYYVCFFKAPMDAKEKELRDISLIGILLMWLILTVTSLGTAWNRNLEPHYLLNAFYLFFPCVGIALANLYRAKLHGIVRWAAVAGLLFFVCTNDYISYADWKPAAADGRPSYLDAIMERGYGFGWSNDYSLANCTAALSDDAVKMAWVTVDNDGNLFRTNWGDKKEL